MLEGILDLQLLLLSYMKNTESFYFFNKTWLLQNFFQGKKMHFHSNKTRQFPLSEFKLNLNTFF